MESSPSARAMLQPASHRGDRRRYPEMFDERRGQPVEIDELAARIAEAQAHGVEGVTFLGGESFEQPAELVALARGAKALAMTVMVFSGYALDELRARADAAELLAPTDLLVDCTNTAQRWCLNDRGTRVP